MSLQSNSENREHLKYVQNICCVVNNHRTDLNHGNHKKQMRLTVTKYQMKSKYGKNTKVTHFYIAECARTDFKLIKIISE